MIATERGYAYRPPEGLTEPYLLDKYKDGITRAPAFGDDCWKYYNQLHNPDFQNKNNWTDDDRRMFDLAERVALESFEYKVLYTSKKTRFDGHSWMSHVYRIASDCFDRGFDARITAIAILHDVIEDTQEMARKYKEPALPYVITEGMLHGLFDQFDPRIAESVGRLTKLKSDYKERDKSVSTHRLLYDLLESDPEAIVVKLFDRIHYMETADSMDTRKVQQKARETMEYYVPLAIGLGMHDLAEELSNACVPRLKGMPDVLQWPHTYKEYAGAMDAITQRIHEYQEHWQSKGFDTGIVSWRNWFPSLENVYRMTFGRADKLEKAWIPGFITVVMKNTEAPGGSRIHPSFTHIANPLMQHLLSENIITEDQMNEFDSILNAGVHRTMHIDLETGGAPVRLRFVLEEEELKWQSSILDYNNQGARGEEYYIAAREKIDDLRNMYKFYVDQEVSSKALMKNIKECLIRGTTMVRIGEDKDQFINFYLPANATAMDMALAYSSDDLDPNIDGVERYDPDSGTWKSESFTAKLQRDQLYRVHYGDVPNYRIDMFDEVRTQYGSDQVRHMLREQMKQGVAGGDYTVAQKLADAGAEIIDRVYAQYAKFHRKDPKLRVSVAVARKAINAIHLDYPYGYGKSKKHINVLIRLGLRELPIDAGRTSVVWNIAERLCAYQDARRYVELSLPNIPGQLHNVTGALLQMNVNIDRIQTRDDYSIIPQSRMNLTRKSDLTVVRIWLSKNDYAEFITQGGEDTLYALLG